MALEIERKWLVEGAQALPPEVRAVDGAQIRQGYLTVGEGGAETRVRGRAGMYTLTVKSGRGLVRQETEVELTPQQFEALWPATEGARVEKLRRAFLLEDGLTAELDVYAGANSGLVVVEVEFDDPWGAESFIAPFWFGREVTDDEAYKNRNLAG